MPRGDINFWLFPKIRQPLIMEGDEPPVLDIIKNPVPVTVEMVE